MSAVTYGNDIYTEPEGDPDTLANLGPLRALAGIWEGTGADQHPVVTVNNDGTWSYEEVGLLETPAAASPSATSIATRSRESRRRLPTRSRANSSARPTEVSASAR